MSLLWRPQCVFEWKMAFDSAVCTWPSWLMVATTVITGEVVLWRYIPPYPWNGIGKIDELNGSPNLELGTDALSMSTSTWLPLDHGWFRAMYLRQYRGMDIGFAIDYPGSLSPADELWPGAAKVLDVLDVVFTLIFFLELLLRLCPAKTVGQFVGSVLYGQGWSIAWRFSSLPCLAADEMTILDMKTIISCPWVMSF